MLIAPSGSGKTTIGRNVLSNELVSVTTREKREGEVGGKDYYFISTKEFNDLLFSGSLAEETCYSDSHYGLTYEEIETKLKKGNAFVVVDIRGLNQLKAIYPNSTSIFIKTSKEDATRAMIERGDSLIKIQGRLKTFEQEQQNAVYCDYVVSNKYGKLHEAIKVVKAIVHTHSYYPMGGIIGGTLDVKTIAVPAGEVIWKGEVPTTYNDSINLSSSLPSNMSEIDIKKLSAEIVEAVKKNGSSI
jgi:guanylate kinase